MRRGIFSGLIVDLYGDTAVITAHVQGMEAQADRISARLQGLVPEARVYFKKDEHYGRVEGLARASGYLPAPGMAAASSARGPCG